MPTNTEKLDSQVDIGNGTEEKPYENKPELKISLVEFAKYITFLNGQERTTDIYFRTENSDKFVLLGGSYFWENQDLDALKSKLKDSGLKGEKKNLADMAKVHSLEATLAYLNKGTQQALNAFRQINEN